MLCPTPLGLGLALAIFVVNGLGDAARIAFGAAWDGVFGVTVVVVILWWLTPPRVRQLFT